MQRTIAYNNLKKIGGKFEILLDKIFPEVLEESRK
jgi:hypothetical protein